MKGMDNSLLDLVSQKYLQLTRKYRKERKLLLQKDGSEYFPLSHRSGPHLDFMTGSLPLKKFEPLLAQCLADFRLGVRKGFTYPLPVVEKIRSQLTEMVTELTERKERKALEALVPLKEFFDSEYVPRKGDGVWSLPNPSKDYLFLNSLEYNLSIRMKPFLLRKLAKREIKRLKSRLLELHPGLKYSQVVEKYREGSATADFAVARQISPDEKGVAEEMSRLCGESYKTLHDFFYTPMIPEEGSLSIKKMDRFKEEGASGGSYRPSKEKGVLYFNEKRLRGRNRIFLPCLARHEGVPGHHLERTWMKRRFKKPLSDSFCAFKEGWALYAESLTTSKNAEDEVGVLFSNLHRAVRLLLDTEIHADKYRLSWEEAKRMFCSLLPLPESTGESEVLRILCEPGKVSCYKVGELILQAEKRKVLRFQRNRGPEDLKSGKSLKDFHWQVLFLPLPLKLLPKYLKELRDFEKSETTRFNFLKRLESSVGL